MPSRSSRVAAAFLLYFDRKSRKLRRDRHWTGDPKSAQEEIRGDVIYSTVWAISYNVLTFVIRSQASVVRFGSYWCHLKGMTRERDDQGNIELKFIQDPLHIF
jgi:hypothetical protein